MKIISLFSGAGGLDLGFEKAGFNVIWANEYDKSIWETYEKNHPHTFLDKRSIRQIPSNDIPDCDGIIGGPPCQSWSEAGTLKGINDERGKLFFEFIRVLKDKQPKFFLAENVNGMLFSRHSEAIENIKNHFKRAGYQLSQKILNAKDFGVPQDRKRVFFVGIRQDLDQTFSFPEPMESQPNLKNAIFDLMDLALPAKEKNHTNDQYCSFPNHEYLIGGFSTIFMSRNRVRAWNQPSFTIQAGGRHAPIHPQAPPMHKIGVDQFVFDSSSLNLYRRLSVRECARIQTFPDNFIFYYKSLLDGYKMVGNAVPVKLAQALACELKIQIEGSTYEQPLASNL